MSLQAKSIYRSIGKTQILQGIDVVIQPWKATWIVWPNWCWKTSFLNCLNWFTKPNYGNIYYKEIDITHQSVEKRANQGIWRVFQSPWIIKSLSLYDNLALAFVTKVSWRQRILPTTMLPTWIKEKIYKILQDVDLYNKRFEYAANLSWWQMRLLEIARLYLQDMDIFLLDEPTAWVSPKLKTNVINLLNKILQLWKTVVIVEHDFAFLSSFVDEFYVFDQGKVVAKGDYESIKNDTMVKEIYFW